MDSKNPPEAADMFSIWKNLIDKDYDYLVYDTDFSDEVTEKMADALWKNNCFLTSIDEIKINPQKFKFEEFCVSCWSEKPEYGFLECIHCCLCEECGKLIMNKAFLEEESDDEDDEP